MGQKYEGKYVQNRATVISVWDNLEGIQMAGVGTMPSGLFGTKYTMFRTNILKSWIITRIHDTSPNWLQFIIVASDVGSKVTGSKRSFCPLKGMGTRNDRSESRHLPPLTIAAGRWLGKAALHISRLFYSAVRRDWSLLQTFFSLHSSV